MSTVGARSLLAAAFSAGLCMTTLPTLAQEARPPEVGSRVRVTASDLFRGRQTGTVLAQSAVSYSVRFEGGDSVVVIPNEAITRLEVSRGPSNRAGRGALYGFLAGYIAGYAWEDSKPNKDIDTRPLVGTLMGIPGALIGAMWGSTIPSDKWEVVPLPGGGVSGMSGVGFRITVLAR